MPAPNPNHHLWRNGRLWWIAFTVIYDGWRQERIRRSLRTADLDEARTRRDDLLQEYASVPNAEVVAFRSQNDVPFRVELEPADRDGFSIRRSALGSEGEAFRA